MGMFHTDGQNYETKLNEQTNKTPAQHTDCERKHELSQL